MTLEYTLFDQLPLNMCGKWSSQIDNVNDQNQASSAEGANRRHLADAADAADGDAADADAADADAADANADAADADAADADAADANADAADAADGSSNGDDGLANCPGDGLYSFQVSYTLPNADPKTSWLATGWTGSGEISIYAEKDNTYSLMGHCTIKLGTTVTKSPEKSYNPPTALVASLIAVGTVIALFLICLYCTCCRSYRRPPRNKEYLDHDPIEFDRSRSTEASYQNMSQTKPWASTGSKSSGRQWA